MTCPVLSFGAALGAVAALMVAGPQAPEHARQNHERAAPVLTYPLATARCHTMSSALAASARRVLAPNGTLVAGINLSNFLLVRDKEKVVGTAPAVAAALAESLACEVAYVPYANPGLLTDAAAAGGAFAVGLVGNEPQRAAHMAFSTPYCAIEATYLVRGERTAAVAATADVDAPGTKVLVPERAAYDLFLSRPGVLEHASLDRVSGAGGVRAARHRSNAPHPLLE